VKHGQHHFKGIALAVTALACFAFLDTTTKYVTLTVPVLLALWFRYMFQAVATTLVMWPLRGRALLRTAHPKFQVLRGVLLVTSSLFAFMSLKYMPVGEFTAILMITPLVITLLAAHRLRERVSPLRWTLVLGGFAGTVIIVRPGSELFGWSMLLPIALVATNAWFQVLTSQLARTEEAVTMHFYTGWTGALIATLALPFVWALPQNTSEWGGLLLMGLLASVGHFLLIQAYRRAPAATITPFLYAQIAFAMLGGWLIFSHVPDGWSLLGMAMIAACGAASAWLTARESRVLPLPVES
jgi:drug/metabolite transporter (DMT)-like permease